MDEKENPSTPAPSLSRIAFKAVCGQLETSLRDEKASASFACGGTIPVKCTDAANPPTIIAEDVPEPGERLKSSGPVNIFWELKDESAARKLTLPLGSSVETNDSSNSLTRLRQLVTDCEPAPFGRHQETVLDTQYRKAGKLETYQFATTFHPADFGIIQRVEQVLLPTLQNLTQQFLKIRRLEIELYKLNVYSGPSGLFKSHVDTPRSKNQIGSLVVCLPSPFKGGNLIVRHEGREVNFDWEHRSADSIQWAAFYSDCEHEIKMVNQGERITLTYNLYAVTELLDKANRVSAIIDPKSFPMYQDFKSLLQMPAFMKTGGVLGAFCSHAYPHASSDASALLPRGLKGADLVLYSVLHALGVEVDVLPVMIGCGNKDINRIEMDSSDYYESDRHISTDEDDYSDGKHRWGYESDHNLNSGEDHDNVVDDEHGNDSEGNGPELNITSGGNHDNDVSDNNTNDSEGYESDHNINSDEDDDNDSNEIKWYNSHLTNPDRNNEVQGNSGKSSRRKNRKKADDDGSLTYYDPGQKVRIGKSLNPHVAAQTYVDQWFRDILKKHWPTRCYEKPITWVTAPKAENMKAAMAYLAYGNEASQIQTYSYATIIAVIPPWSERQKLLAKLEDK